MLMFTIEGDLPLAEKRSLLDWVIRPQLRTLPGVADVNSLGGHVRTFEVTPQLMALKARSLMLADLQRALETNNRNDGAGRLTEGDESLLVRIEGSIKGIDDIRAIVVADRNGVVTRVGDVADVHIGSLTRYGFVTHGGKGETVEGLVLGLRGANARQVVEGVRAKLKEIEPMLPKGVSINIFYDRGVLVDHAVGTVSKALYEAIILVLVLLFAFLGNLRAAITVACVLPLAALFTFIMMQLFGMSANLMSLGGLAIAIGMLVDAAVVVVENIESHLAQPGIHSAAAPFLPRGTRGRRARRLRRGHHHHRVSALAHPAGAGRQAVHSRRADHRLRAFRFAAAFFNDHSGARLLPDQTRSWRIFGHSGAFSHRRGRTSAALAAAQGIGDL
jgi:cobalt-zinc-cadmium resistance protein CzcA